MHHTHTHTHGTRTNTNTQPHISQSLVQHIRYSIDSDTDIDTGNCFKFYHRIEWCALSSYAPSPLPLCMCITCHDIRLATHMLSAHTSPNFAAFPIALDRKVHSLRDETPTHCCHDAQRSNKVNHAFLEESMIHKNQSNPTSCPPTYDTAPNTSSTLAAAHRHRHIFGEYV